MASEQPFFEKEVTYKVGSKERRFIFFANAMLSERNK
jgi:hypothetical protein